MLLVVADNYVLLYAAGRCGPRRRISVDRFLVPRSRRPPAAGIRDEPGWDAKLLPLGMFLTFSAQAPLSYAGVFAGNTHLQVAQC